MSATTPAAAGCAATPPSGAIPARAMVSAHVTDLLLRLMAAGDRGARGPAPPNAPGPTSSHPWASPPQSSAASLRPHAGCARPDRGQGDLLAPAALPGRGQMCGQSSADTARLHIGGYGYGMGLASVEQPLDAPAPWQDTRAAVGDFGLAPPAGRTWTHLGAHVPPQQHHGTLVPPCCGGRSAAPDGWAPPPLGAVPQRGPELPWTPNGAHVAPPPDVALRAERGGGSPSPLQGPGPITTWMVRNIPRHYTQDMLLQHWPTDGAYDFLYLPPDQRCDANAGYAFINFRSEDLALDFKANWHRRFLGDVAAPQARLSIIPADIQGLDANLRQLRRKRVCRIAHRGWQPIVLEPEQLL